MSHQMPQPKLSTSTNSSASTALIRAVAEGDHVVVETLLTAGADVNAADGSGVTPLLTAVHNENLAIVKQLVAAGARADHVDGTGMTALMWAVYADQVAIVDVLITAGASVNTCIEGADSPLMEALKVPSIRLVKTLVDAGADVNYVNRDGLAVLALAAKLGVVDAIPVLVAAGANLDQVDEWESSALHHAIQEEHRSVVEQLLKSHMACGGVGRINYRPLCTSTIRRDTQLVRLLLEAGVDVNKTDEQGQTALILAARKGFDDILALLLIADGVNVDHQDADGNTALTHAIRTNSAAVVRLLHTSGADLSLSNRSQEPPLMRASQWRKADVLDALVELGADVTARDANGWTALHHAVYPGSARTVEVLLATGSMDVDAVTNDGETALYMAVRYGRLKVVEILLAWGARMDHRTATGTTALITASGNRRRNSWKTVTTLLKAGADVCCTWPQAETAFRLAAESDNVAVLELLVEYAVGLHHMNDQGRNALMLAIAGASRSRSLNASVGADVMMIQVKSIERN